MELTANAIKVLESRYLRRNESGNLMETPEQLFERVAKAIARPELNYGNAQDASRWEEKFLKIMKSLKFLPNSPTLMNAGTQNGQLSACFVLPVHDSMDSIFDTLKVTSLIQQSGGGTGFNFSELRPKGDLIHSTSGRSSGPVSFMKVYSAATEAIKQGGKRRGANMGILNISHPDIREFIRSKEASDALLNFNISVGITDAFMKAVEQDEDWELTHPGTGQVMETVKADELWKEIIEYAWKTGDPGLIFLDTIEKSNPTPDKGRITCTNPCGEVPLLPYESCNLGSINLSRFIDKKGTIYWEELADTIHIALRFLDNVIDENQYLASQISEQVRGNRKVGLGVMGWAHFLIRAGIPYESREALELGRKVMKFFKTESDKASLELAKERGTFPNWKDSIFAPDHPYRNATRTSIAPTGTISTIAGTSPSIEPLFALAFERSHVLEGEKLTEMDPLVVEYFKDEGEELLEAIQRSGSLKGTSVPKKDQELFKTSLEIHWTAHIDHQVAFQKYTDNAVSKTINLPEQAGREEIEQAYWKAWQENAKGITVFRYNSKGSQVYTAGMEASGHPCKVCSI